MDGTAKVIVLGVLAAMLAGCATLMIDGVLLERGVWAVDAAYGTTNLFLSAVPATLELSGADIVVTFRTDLGTLRLRYLDETIDGARARVGLLILTRRDVNIPVEVRLIRRDERWLVWDVVLDGISVVGNYRAQFDRIMRRCSYATLVAHLRAKTADRKSTRLNSSHGYISYAVFCLKKKKKQRTQLCAQTRTTAQQP